MRNNNRTYTAREVRGKLSDFTGKVITCYVIALIYGLFHLKDWDGVTIAITSILSIIIILVYNALISSFKAEKTYLQTIIGFLMLIPFLSACFFVFYKGFWSFKYLFNSFSFWGLIAPIIWIMLGYRIISNIYIMSDIIRFINEGKMKIEGNE